MQILAIEKEAPGVTSEDFRPHMKAEAMRAWELYQSGIFREMYFTRDDHNAVIMMECASVEEAERALATLPLVKAGLISFELMPLVPYPGFARLFA
jgi:muconolactone delta-isomerase